MAEEVVYHPRYGQGIVRERRHRGQELYVAFDDGHRRWVPATQIQRPSSRPARAPTAQSGPQPTPAAFAAVHPAPQLSPALPETTHRTEAPQPEQPTAPPVPVIQTTPGPVLPECPPSAFQSRRIVEAFRMGIVPEDCVASMTVGRDRELASLLSWLDEDTGSAVIVGEYGSGKSHLLRYLHHQARDQGYAVAQVQIEPNETPLYKPKRVYRDVALSLQYRVPGSGEIRGFRELVGGALAVGALGDHRHMRVLRDGYATDPVYEDLLWEWLEARQNDARPVDWVADGYGYRYNRFTYVPPIYDHTTGANIICYLLSGLAWASRSLGLRGLVLIFDEAESMSMSASASQVDRARNFVSGLVRVTNDEELLLADPVKSGLTSSGMGGGQTIPFLYRRDCRLRAVFGFTPSPELDRVATLSSAFRLDLQPLSRGALDTLYAWIQGHYGRAYGIDYTAEERRQFLNLTLMVLERSGNTRYFTKACMEILDLIRFLRSEH